jgi:hypothetical protein
MAHAIAIVRPMAGLRAWLSSSLPSPTRCLSRRPSHQSVRDQPRRLTEIGVAHTADELSEALVRLCDVGHLVMAAAAIPIALCTERAASARQAGHACCRRVRCSAGGTGSASSPNEQLQSWLDEDGVQWNPRRARCGAG